MVTMHFQEPPKPPMNTAQKLFAGLLLLALSMATVFDAATSFLGVVGIFGDSQNDSFSAYSLLVYLIAFITTLTIILFNFVSYSLWTTYPIEAGTIIFRLCHVIAIGYDFFTSFFGMAEFVVLEKINMEDNPIISSALIWDNSTIEQKILILFVTIVIVASPIILSAKFTKA
jgi:hypothetical protein